MVGLQRRTPAGGTARWSRPTMRAASTAPSTPAQEPGPSGVLSRNGKTARDHSPLARAIASSGQRRLRRQHELQSGVSERARRLEGGLHALEMLFNRIAVLGTHADKMVCGDEASRAVPARRNPVVTAEAQRCVRQRLDVEPPLATQRLDEQPSGQALRFVSHVRHSRRARGRLPAAAIMASLF